MIQDIAPYQFNNEYTPGACTAHDRIISFDEEGKLLARVGEDGIEYADASKAGCPDDAVYLFSISGHGYYMANIRREDLPGSDYYTVRQLRDRTGGYELFAGFTAYHLWQWYSSNRYCGRCGSATVPDDTERALVCRKCGNVIYPRINPAVIVGVINNDSMLITRYRSGYSHNALIAGFTEIGETLEETVAREVREEAGLMVRNIRYYKSQPWGMAMDILAGFFCDVDGDTDIRMDDGELRYAAWTRREDIVLQPDGLSLTNEMMRMFKEDRIADFYRTVEV